MVVVEEALLEEAEAEAHQAAEDAPAAADLEAGDPVGEEEDVPAEAEVAQEASKHRNQSCIES